MDFLNPFIAQVRELFAQMTPAARVTAGLLMAVVVVSLGFLFQQAITGTDAYLFGGEPFPAARLHRIEGALAQANIDYTLEGNRIRVGRSQHNDAVAAITDAGELPTDVYKLMDDAINGGSVLDMGETRRWRYYAGREAQASAILSKMHWVDNAYVVHNPATKTGYQRQTNSTAAVTLLPAVGQSLTPVRVRNIKDLVAKFCNVPMDEITVQSLGSDTLADAGGGVTAEDFDSPYFKNRLLVENRLRANILQNLTYIPGVSVQVNARIKNDSQTVTTSVKPEKETVAIAKSEVDEKQERSTGREGDAVGVDANDENNSLASVGPAAARRSKESRLVTDQEYVAGYTKETQTQEGFAIEEAEASIVIPESYVEAVYRRENRDADGVEPTTFDEQQLTALRERIQQTVEEIVKPLLPKLQLGQDEYRQLQVSFIRDLEKPPIPEPSMAANALALANDYGGVLAMFGMAVASLVMLRTIASGAGKGDAPTGLPSLQLDGEEADADPEDEEPIRPRLKLRKSDTLKDDLTEMVGNDPDAAAAILRAWINNGTGGGSAAA